ncbi:MAG: DUF4159 domain-containing protein [bacterium]|nr:DUF4159 domain-containing protein [bacterium]
MRNIPDIVLLFLVTAVAISGQWLTDEVPPGKIVIAKVKYGGGGDWYANPSSLPNLHRYIAKNTDLPFHPIEDDVVVELASEDLDKYPLLYMTGHGNVRFSDAEITRLRKHLMRGGFLHVDDNYGMDQYWRREVERLFPDSPMVELPLDNEIYSEVYEFPDGLPKIHEHYGGPARGYGVFYEGRMVIFYSYNTDLGDGWEDAEVHEDPPSKREAALKMGTNTFVYALNH